MLLGQKTGGKPFHYEGKVFMERERRYISDAYTRFSQTLGPEKVEARIEHRNLVALKGGMEGELNLTLTRRYGG